MPIFHICDKCGLKYDYEYMWLHFYGNNVVQTLCEKCKKETQLENMCSEKEHQYISVKKMSELLEPLRRNYERNLSRSSD